MQRDLAALVDLGSNSVRLLVARVESGVGYRILREERVQTRLGGGADARLPAAAVRGTAEAVVRFVRGLPDSVQRLLGVATAAVRDAPNAGDLLDRLRAEVGIEVEVLSAREEARLGALAARAALQLNEATVVDVGGRSLQVSAIRAREPIPLASVSLGTLVATRRFLRRDPPDPEDLDALRDAVRVAVGELVPRARPREMLIGVGGTARALGRLRRAGAPGPARVGVGLEDLAAICGRLAVVGLDERRRLAGLKPDRADAIVAGAVVFDEIARLAGYSGLLVAGHGVRHGVLLRETFERKKFGREVAAAGPRGSGGRGGKPMPPTIPANLQGRARRDAAAFYLSELARGLLHGEVRFAAGEEHASVMPSEFVVLEIACKRRCRDTQVEVTVRWPSPSAVSGGAPRPARAPRESDARRSRREHVI